MRYAETGFNLEIDLSTGNIERVETDPKLMELHLGGLGTAARIIWERVPPEVGPFDPENLLIFSTGLLCGTAAPGINRTIVNTISPVTNYLAHSMMGGYFSAEMKFAGYDKFIFSGKSSKLVYLYVNNDHVEIRDASHLKGKGAQLTAEMIRNELGDPNIQVASIGLAGENRVFTASIEHSHSSASRGPAPVMGDKNLKAVAVRGTKDVHVANPEEFFEMSFKSLRSIGVNPNVGDWMAYTWNDGFHTDNFSWGNARVRRKGYWSPEVQEDWKQLTRRYLNRKTGCYNCLKECKLSIQLPDKPAYGAKCFSKVYWHLAAFESLDFTWEVLGITQEYGLDNFSTPATVAYAMELFEEGVLTLADLPDFPLNNKERYLYLIDKIVKREGIGDILADGSWAASRAIGRGAEKYEHNCIKKFEQLPLKLAKVNMPYFLMFSTGEKINITQIQGSYPQDPLKNPEKRKKYCDGWIAAPQRFKEFYMAWEPRTEPDLKTACHICDWNEAIHYLDDAFGTCAFVSSFRGQFGGKVAYHIYNYPKYFNLATGLNLDSQDMWQIARRNRNLVRAISISRGLTRDQENPPEDHWKIRLPEEEQQVLSMYYEFKGWTNEGVPTKPTMDKLELGFVADELIRRGHIAGDETNVYEETTTYPEPTDEELDASVFAATQKMSMEQGGG